MTVSETDLGSMLKEAESHAKLAEKLKRDTDLLRRRCIDQSHLAREHEEACKSNYAQYKQTYLDEMFTLAVRWGRTGDLSAPPPEMAALLAKVLRELWGVKKDPKIPEPVEQFITDLLRTATKPVALNLVNDRS